MPDTHPEPEPVQPRTHCDLCRKPVDVHADGLITIALSYSDPHYTRHTVAVAHADCLERKLAWSALGWLFTGRGNDPEAPMHGTRELPRPV